MVGLVEKIAKLSSETKNVKKPITATASSDSVPSSSQVAISLPAKPVGKAFQDMITSAFSKAPHNTLQDILKETISILSTRAASLSFFKSCYLFSCQGRLCFCSHSA